MFGPMPFYSLLSICLYSICLCELFAFTEPNQSLRLRFKLDPNNINTGFFKTEIGSNLTYHVEIASLDNKKIFFKNSKLEEGNEAHFSFNNPEAQDVVLTINSLLVNVDEPARNGMIQMKFESTDDTFNQEVAKKKQIEPAIYALERILKKMNDVTASSRSVSSNIGTLGDENRRMLALVLVFSFLSLAGYIIFNAVQLIYMRNYLNEKKYL